MQTAVSDPTLTAADGRLSWLWPDGTLLPVVSGGADDGDDGDQDGKDDGGADGDGEGDGGSQLTPEQQTAVDAEVEKRLGASMAKKIAAEQKKWEKAAAEKAEREKMDDAERAKAEKADAEKAAAEKVSGANARLVKAEAKSAALAAGVKADRVDRFLRNVDLDDIEVDDDGKIDEAAVGKAVKQALDDVPEFKGGASNGKGGASGGDFGGDAKPAQLTHDQLKGMTPKEITEAKKEGKLRDLLGQT